MQPDYEAAKLAHFKKALSEMDIPLANKQSIDEFLTHIAMRNLSKSRMRTIIEDLLLWASIITKPFKECTRKDIENAIATLNGMKNKNGQPYAGWTKRRKIFTLKTFFKFLNGDEVYPECVRWIKNDVLNYELPELTEKDIITQEDLRQLLHAATSEQEAAIVYVLWESGARASEFLDTKIEDLEDKKTHYTLTLRTRKRKRSVSIPKTRKVPLIESAPYLRAWLKVHPMKNEPTAPLWVSESTNKKARPLSDRGLRFIIKKIAERSKLKKPIWVHLFRHSCASRLATKVSPHTLNMLLGWAKSSKMWNVYLHLSNQQIEDDVLKLYGIEPSADSKPQPISMKKCPVCGLENLPSEILCKNCGRALDTIAAVDIEKKSRAVERKIKKVGQLEHRVKELERIIDFEKKFRNLRRKYV